MQWKDTSNEPEKKKIRYVGRYDCNEGMMKTMRKRNRYTAGFIISIVAVIILNCINVYFNCQSQKYFLAGDRIISKKTADTAQNILVSYDYDKYQSAYNSLKTQYSDITQYYELITRFDGVKNKTIYITAKDKQTLKKYNLSQAQTEECIEQIQYCMDRLEYAINFPIYISKINSSASDMSAINIFSEPVRKNIIKTGADFYGLENIHISAESELGIKLLFSDTVSDILAVLASVVCALFYSLRCRAEFSENSADKSHLPLFAVIFSVCIMFMYIFNILPSDMAADVGNLKRAVQSVSDFHSCPYVISVGMLIFLRIVFKTVACLTIYLLCTGIFSGKKKKLSIFLVLFIIASEIVMHFMGVRINFIEEFKAENIIAKYGNVIILGESIDPLGVFIVLTLVLLLAVVLYANKNISASLILAAERAEKAYIDRLNERYTEVRLMRHDLKNHLSVIAVLLDEGDMDSARKYLGEISEELDDIKPPVKTGSAVLDALLFKKYSFADSNGITVNTEFTVDFSSCGFTDYDLCGIFGNILDNAFEACALLPENEKNISLTVKNQMDMICIFCENKYKEISRTNGIFNTTKSDRNFHGMGINQITKISAKYGGDIKISCENDLFTISVLLMKSK